MNEIFLIDTNKINWDWINKNINILTNEELSRSEGFKNNIIKKRFLITHIYVYLIAKEKNIQINKINLKEGFKPKIQNSNKSISISYTENISSILFSENQSSIDIEKSRDNIKIDSNHIANNNEIPNLNYQKMNFFTIWTIKESILKFNGTGLRNDIKNIDINKFIETGDFILYDDKKIYIKNFKLKDIYCAISSNKKINNLNLFYLKPINSSNSFMNNFDQFLISFNENLL